MKVKVLAAITIITGLTILLYGCDARQNSGEPVTFTTDASIRALTIDEKIREAQIILIGEVKTTLPSKWKLQDQKDAKSASPQDFVEARTGLFTDSIISVKQIIKGDYQEPLVRVRSFTGETEQVRWESSSEPTYEKGHLYLLFLERDFGPTAHVDPGDFISVNSNTAVYEIVDGKAISSDDEWVLEELIAYIQTSLAAETSSPMPTSLPVEPLTETPLPFTDTPVPTDLPTETMLPIEPTSPTP